MGGPASPGSSPVLRKEGIPAAREPRSSLAPGSPTPIPGRRNAPSGSSPPARRGEGARCSGPGLRPESGHAAPSRPRLRPWGRRGEGERQVGGRGRRCEPGWVREGPRRLQGRVAGAAGQAGKSHTRSGSGDAPAAPLLRLDLAADSGLRICIFWHPVEKERRTEPAAFKGAAQTVASPREAVWVYVCVSVCVCVCVREREGEKERYLSSFNSLSLTTTVTGAGAEVGSHQS